MFPVSMIIAWEKGSDRNGLVWVGIGMVNTAKTWYGLKKSQYHGITGIPSHTGKAKMG
jgi:hypothetical protein